MATIEELVIAHPDLLTSQHPMGQLRIHLGAIAEDQQRWKEKLARGLPGTLKRGEFRRDGSWYGTAMAHTEEGEGGRGEGTRRKIHGAPEHGRPAPHRRSREPAIAQKEQRTVCGDHERKSLDGGWGEDLE